RDALCYAGRLEYLAGERDGSGEIDQRPAGFRPYAKNLGEHRSSTAADIYHAPHSLPAAADPEIRVRRAVPFRPNAGVATRRHLRLPAEVFPKRQAEVVAVGGRVCSEIGEEISPSMTHPTADAIQIKPDELLWV